MGFRYDINGLRAWAVAAVVLYHFEIPGFTSGFVGVDVFFVISGYLMTRIIVEGYENRGNGEKQFRIVDFYLARARRIIPAIALLSVFLLALGWFALTPEEYSSLGSEVFFALSFTSNYKYWINPEGLGGYFADDELLRWLLHSWSLSVEWQFYLVLPLLIGLLWSVRPSRGFLMWALAGLALLSLTASIVETNRDAELAFYSIHTRAWEMLSGGMVFFARNKFSAQGALSVFLELLGFSLLLASIVLEQPEQEWPGYRALLPILGTVLILLANRQNSIWTRTAPIQFLGKVSYSVYLWHWPVVVALGYLSLLATTVGVAIGFALTVVLSILSYHISEKPARHWIGRRPFWMGTLIVSAIAITTASAGTLARLVPNFPVYSSLLADSVEQRVDLDYNPRRDECTNPEVPGPVCLFGDGSTLAAIAMGDSHTLSIVSAIVDALPNRDHHVLTMSSAGCPTLREAKSWVPNARCFEYNEWALGKLSEFPESVPVIITNRFSTYLFGGNEIPAAQRKPLIYYGEEPEDYPNQFLLDRYRKDQISLLCDIAATRPTYVVQPIPEMGIDVGKLSRRRARFGLPHNFSIERTAYNSRNSFVRETLSLAASQCGVQVLDPATYLCSATSCWGSRNDEILYFDDDHLSETGNKLLVPMFQSIWMQAEPDASPED